MSFITASKTHDKLKQWLKDDEMAITFCQDIIFIAHLWDDLIDHDERPAADVNHAFTAALINIPQNPFYQAFQSDLRPVMLQAILQWQAANDMENGSKQDRDKAYMLRASILHIILHCAYLVGGVDWANRVSIDIYRFYNESIDTYYEGNNHA